MATMVPAAKDLESFAATIVATRRAAEGKKASASRKMAKICAGV